MSRNDGVVGVRGCTAGRAPAAVGFTMGAEPSARWAQWRGPRKRGAHKARVLALAALVGVVEPSLQLGLGSLLAPALLLPSTLNLEDRVPDVLILGVGLLDLLAERVVLAEELVALPGEVVHLRARLPQVALRVVQCRFERVDEVDVGLEV